MYTCLKTFLSAHYSAYSSNTCCYIATLTSARTLRFSIIHATFQTESSMVANSYSIFFLCTHYHSRKKRSVLMQALLDSEHCEHTFSLHDASTHVTGQAKSTTEPSSGILHASPTAEFPFVLLLTSVFFCLIISFVAYS